ncbi:hypothetical protein [Allosphingosinicella indica]|uniref:Uncharacterized protein n=1 Tax=Allosphingosinicella indica TaxID=941907 RepID=A0A1X7GLI8_9SPHN|nr:hypothetical protein [Allosphingosinicella indica]SMF70848.1 hypothetical protein SAMN06295910_1959 [Allosphingosinicella indica]
MTAGDFDEFAALWTDDEQSGAEDRAIVERLAARTSWRASAVEYLEWGLAALLMIAIAAAILVEGRPAALIVGACLAGAILWSSWRRHKLRQVARDLAFGDRPSMLETAIRAARADLRRSNLGVGLILPGFMLGALLQHIAKSGGIAGFGEALIASMLRGGPPLAGYVVLGAVIAWLIRSNRQLRTSLRRLEDLLAEYREEERLDRDEL